MTQPESLMREGADALVDGVERLGAAWVVLAVTRTIDAWGRLDDEQRAAALKHARAAGEQAAHAGGGRAARPVRDRARPRSGRRRSPSFGSLRFEATAVLRDAGVPEVERDEFDTRAFPDDIYGIVPKAVTELGDEALGGALLAWGMGKARVLRASAEWAGRTLSDAPERASIYRPRGVGGRATARQ